MNENRCVVCGDIIPEGRQICPICDEAAMLDGFREVKNNADTGTDSEVH